MMCQEYAARIVWPASPDISFQKDVSLAETGFDFVDDRQLATPEAAEGTLGRDSG